MRESRHGEQTPVLNSNGSGPTLESGLNILANLQVSLGQIATEIKQTRDQAQQLWQGVRPLPEIIVPQITTTNGTADYPELLSPRTGYWWDVRMAGAFTFSAGSVNLHLTAVQDSNIHGAFPSAGYLTYASGQLLFNWNARLIFKAVAVTGNVTPNLTVTEVADWALPAYLL